ncbi:MAG: hypothetical protein N3A66_09285 [Planctomycetota bacterium]|nr:hypothetical protein [Planctomycetota bacterium]
MVDVARETYRRLMAEIQSLEEKAAALEQEIEMVRESASAADMKTWQEELHSLKQMLAEKRNELQRLSDGCGKPHAR